MQRVIFWINACSIQLTFGELYKKSTIFFLVNNGKVYNIRYEFDTDMQYNKIIFIAFDIWTWNLNLFPLLCVFIFEISIWNGELIYSCLFQRRVAPMWSCESSSSWPRGSASPWVLLCPRVPVEAPEAPPTPEPPGAPDLPALPPGPSPR